MPEKINITEYYSVSCRPYDDCSVSLLENAARAFFPDEDPSEKKARAAFSRRETLQSSYGRQLTE